MLRPSISSEPNTIGTQTRVMSTQKRLTEKKGATKQEPKLNLAPQKKVSKSVFFSEEVEGREKKQVSNASKPNNGNKRIKYSRILIC